jgi:uncharacterized protein YdaU (DUF1376 family)
MSEFNLPYFPFHVEQWGTSFKIQSLPDTTRLIFYDLLCYLWHCEGMAPNKPQEIAFHLRRTVDQWEAAKDDLMAAELIYVIQDNKMIHNPLLRLEWERVADICVANKTRASKGGKARWKKTT